MDVPKRRDLFVATDELEAVGVKPRQDRSERDALERFCEVPNHAMFLFTSEDAVLDQYIRNHWSALDGLSGQICDIHVSLMQLQGMEDAYTQLDDIRTIRGLANVSFDVLPALHIWSDDASITFSLTGVSVQLDKLRDALRNIFAAMHTLGGPISQAWVDGMRNWDHHLNGSVNGVAQSIIGSSAGRDIVQILHFHNTSSHALGVAMANTKGEPKPEVRSGQTIEDVVAGKNIIQSSETTNDNQAIRRAGAVGDVSQTKHKTSEMSFLGGKAGGWGIVGLVIAILAWLAYKYLVKT